MLWETEASESVGTASSTGGGSDDGEVRGVIWTVALCLSPELACAAPPQSLVAVDVSCCCAICVHVIITVICTCVHGVPESAVVNVCCVTAGFYVDVG